MTRLATFARLHWLEILTVAFLAVGAFKLAATNGWWRHLTPSLIALYGGVSVLFPDEVAATTGAYGWTRASWRQDPPEWVRWLGAVLVLGGVGTILGR